MYADEVNGIVVGEETPYGACLFYDGRAQSRIRYFETDIEAEKYIRDEHARIRKDMGHTYRDIFPKTHLWEGRVWVE